MNKKFITLGAVIIFISSVTFAAQMVTIKKTGKVKGAVTFNHDAHKKAAQAEGKNCKTCHHKGPTNQSCADAGCHNDANLDRAGKRIHKTCLSLCHKPKFKDKAPITCNDKRCHK
ncbi:MAG TPA: cytochrome c3 family protein [Spirochaetota bacterium]|nr:cytochrome c3 family protein [Spirochaetota bacterium]HPI88850.1 cytochrome c3 family protein [Spirochaetota bacterium]HPR47662.1 cytochrome c3 family protein [Spirochaetota bacterium]